MAAITTAALGTAMGAYQMIDGMNRKKDAQNRMNEYERQTLTNAYDNMQISTVGSDLMREQNGQTSADLVYAARDAGIRGVLGGLPKIQSGINTQNQEARNYLDGQVMKRDYSRAEDSMRIRDIKEQRDRENLAAISSEIQAGRQDEFSGMMGAAKGIMYGANNIDFGDGSYQDKQMKKQLGWMAQAQSLGGAKGSNGYTPSFGTRFGTRGFKAPELDFKPYEF